MASKYIIRQVSLLAIVNLPVQLLTYNKKAGHADPNLRELANLRKLAWAPGGAAPGPLPANLPKIRVQIRASLRPKQICWEN